MLSNTTLVRRAKQLKRAFGRHRFSAPEAVLVSTEGTAGSVVATIQLLRAHGIIESQGRQGKVARTYRFATDASTKLKQLVTT